MIRQSADIDKTAGQSINTIPAQIPLDPIPPEIKKVLEEE